MYSQKINNPSREKWWSYDTPYDIVRRRELILRGETRRVQDIDDYISFINESMDTSYKVGTRFKQHSEKMILKHGLKATQVYRPNSEGIYEQYCTVSMAGEFYGDKVILDAEDPIVINSEFGLGVTSSEYIRFANIQASIAEYAHPYKYRERNFAMVVNKLMSLKEGESGYIKGYYDIP